MRPDRAEKEEPLCLTGNIPTSFSLMTDEHRPDLAGFAGNSIVRTPNLDRLAKDSVVFNHAYTPSPVCIPARQCIMSGQFLRTCGCEVLR